MKNYYPIFRFCLHRKFIVIIAIFFCYSVCIKSQVRQDDNIESLVGIAMNEYQSGNYKKAIKIGENILSIQEEMEADSLEYASITSFLGLCYSRIKDYDKAIVLYKKSLDIRVKKLGSEHIENAYLLNLISFCYEEKKDFFKAITLSKESLKIIGNLEGNAHPDYANLLNNLANRHIGAGNYEEAIKCHLEALSVYEKCFGKSHHNYLLSLNSLVSCYLHIGDSDKAVQLYIENISEVDAEAKNDALSSMKTLALIEELLDELHPNDVASLNYLADYYANGGNYDKAIQFYEEALTIINEDIELNYVDYATLLNNLAVCYSYIDNNEKAIDLNTKALAIRKSHLGKKHPDYAQSLHNLAACYLEMNNYQKAIQLFREALVITQECIGKDCLEYANLLGYLAKCYTNIGNYENSIKLFIDALTIVEESIGKTNLDYSDLLQYLAQCYSEIDDYEEAIKCRSEALFIIEQCLGKFHPDYVLALNNLGSCYYNVNDYNKAIQFYKKALSARELILGKTHIDYAVSLNNLANCYSETGEYNEAVRLHTEALAIREKCLGKSHPDYAMSLNNLAGCYSYLGNYDKAIFLLEQSQLITEKSIGKSHPDYALLLNNLGSCYLDVGDYEKAIKFHTEALSVRGNSLGKDHLDYAQSLDHLAGCYSKIGDYYKATKLHEEALAIRERKLGKTNLVYAYSLNNLAGCYVEVGDYGKSIKYFEEALSILGELLEKTHPNYFTLLSNLAVCYSNVGEYDKAIKLHTEVLSLVEERYSQTNHPDYAHATINFAGCYIDIGNYEQGIKFCCEAESIIEECFGKKHPHYITVLTQLANCYWASKKTDDFVQTWNLLCELKTNHIKDHFAQMSSSMRLNFWGLNESYFKEIVPYYVYYLDDYRYIGNMYNSFLLSKGILLDTEIEFSKLIAESKDEKALHLYKELQYTRTFLNKQYEKPISERVVNIDSLEAVAEKLEEQLIERSQVYGDFTRNLSIDWKQVQKKLSKDDIAIEFVSFPINYDSVMYCALTLKKGYDAPKMISLFEAQQLDSISREKYYESTAIAKLVWKPLDEELRDVENIYFAPDGELYNIAIESLPHYDGEGYMFNGWNFYRLSSTRELAKIKYHPSETKAALYGGLNYDTDITTIENSQQPFDELYIAQYRSEPDSIGLRARYGTLRGTWTEVQLIDSLYSNLKYPSKVYAHNIGTETSLKKLDGQKVSNLHIATHGFYWTETELNEKEDLRGLPFIRDNDRPRFVEDKAMTRSGLLFAGANKVLSGKTVPEGCDDGILTAKEISTLDLRGLDLLVLSACQTGLGEIKGDGVYGLQRGFKMAGAQTIVMSLWKVDDDATQMLMTEFYKRYLSGQSKHDSFLAAQEVVRNFKGEIRGRDRDFSDPKYWAGFIMLD